MNIYVYIHKQLALPRSPLNTQKKPLLIVLEVNLVFLVSFWLFCFCFCFFFHVVAVVVALLFLLLPIFGVAQNGKSSLGFMLFICSLERNLAAALEMVWNLSFQLPGQAHSID